MPHSVDKIIQNRSSLWNYFVENKEELHGNAISRVSDQLPMFRRMNTINK